MAGLAMLTLTSCRFDDKAERRAEVQALTEDYIEDRIERYREASMRRCREDIMEEAQRRVDSLILLEARGALDTLLRPQPLEKPERPQVQSVQDTLPLAPFLRDTSDK